MAKLNTFQQVRELSNWRALAFATALVERMLPNYQLFCEATEFSDAKDMTNLVDVLWDLVKNPKTKVNVPVQLEKIELATPDINQFDGYGVFPALDFAVSIEAAFNLVNGEDPQGAVVISKVSQGCVESFIDVTSEEEPNNEMIKSHPMMIREIEFQQALLQKLTSMPTRDKDVLAALRLFVMQDGLSNIGIGLDEED